MSIATVATAPTTYDYFTLDGNRHPGLSVIESGGEASEKVEDQAQPLTKGANTVVRGTNNAVATYTVRMWTDADLGTWQNTWIPMFLAGRQRTPNPRVYTLVDLRFSWVKRVIFEKLSPMKTEKPGGPWSWALTLHEYNRIAPYGGPLKPLDGQDITILNNSITIAGLSGLLSNQVAASKATDPNAWRKGGS
jgi:hypothetical protein